MSRLIKFEEPTPGRPKVIDPTEELNRLLAEDYIKKHTRKEYRSKKPKDPLSEWKSAWLVTINTNQNNPGLLKPLELVWNYIVSHIEFFTWGRGFIVGKPLETHRVIELSGKYHRLHLHTKLEITTKGFANLDYVKIQKFINRQLLQIPSFKGIYFNARLIKNYNQASLIQQYLEKGPYEYKSEPGGFEII
jgi:hypothetical protein